MAKIESPSMFSFLGNYKSFLIPIYQRDYTWDEEKCLTYLNDVYNNYLNIIEGHTSSLNNYFIGTVVACITEKTNEIILVDGQQRLTTTILFYLALEKYSSDSMNSRYTLNNAKMIAIKNLIKNDQNNFKIRYSQESKIQNLRDINNREELSILFKNKNKNTYLKNFQAIYEWIDNKVQFNSENNINISLSDLIEIFQHTILSVVIINKEENPTKIFEKINNTGEPLTQFDLVRNHIFMNTYTNEFEGKENKLAIDFEKVTKNLDTCKSNSSTKQKRDDFLRYFNVITKRESELSKKNSKNIYLHYQQGINGKESNSLTTYSEVIKAIQELELHSKISNEIYNFEIRIEKNRSSEKSANLSLSWEAVNSQINTYYVLIHEFVYHSFLDKYNNDESIKNLEDYLINDFKNDMYIILDICSKLIYSNLFSGKEDKTVTRSIPKIYSSYLKIKTNNNLNDLTLLEFLTNDQFDLERNGPRILTKNEFLTYAKTSSVYKTNAKSLKSFLKVVMTAQSNNEMIDNLEVEHIVPQNPDNLRDWFIDKSLNTNEMMDRHSSLVNTLGNLTLITGKANKKNSNKNFSVKKQTFIESNNVLNKEFNDIDAFYLDTDQIKNRSNKLMEIFCDFLKI